MASRDDILDEEAPLDCPYCDGTGIGVADLRCFHCKGSGVEPCEPDFDPDDDEPRLPRFYQELP